MEEKISDFERLQAFRQALIAQERSAATVEKYMRNARAFVRFAGEQQINQGLLVSYKALLLETHTARSVNSLLMKMYLADNTTQINEAAADVFPDGAINKKDSLYLKQYLAGLDVELGA